MTVRVTALGIRNGDPAVLKALIARRGSAVLAYCERACPPAQVPAAAAEAFAQFRAAVVAAPKPADLDPEAALLSATRHSAADRAPHAQTAPAGAGLSRLLSGLSLADQVGLVPDLLIARADGTLDSEGEEQLERLLDASASARAAEERFRAAELAYGTAPPRTIPADVVDTIVTAMVSVPAPDAADEPEPDPVPEPLRADPGPEAEAAPPEEDEEPDVVAAAVTSGAAGAAAGAGAGDGDPGGSSETEVHAVPEPTPEDDTEVHDVAEPATEGEIAARRLRKITDEDIEALHEDDEAVEEPEDHEEDEEDEPERVQTASGAVEIPPESPPPPTRRPVAMAARPSLPGKSALAPAAAVVAIAGVSILAYSGVFGGNDPQDPVDTGVAPKVSQVAVPEGEAAAVIEELRRAAAEARRQRLADKRISAPVEPEPEPDPIPEPAPEPTSESQGAAPETPEDEGGGAQAPEEDAAAEDEAAVGRANSEDPAGATTVETPAP